MANPKETAAQRRTRIGMLLADYDDKTRQQRKLAKEVEQMKKEIKELPVGTYGDWILGTGTPREILDQRAAKDALTHAGIPIPTQMTDAPVTVTPKAGR